MALESLIIWLIVGAVAGWLASQIMKRGGLALTGNALVDSIITGIIGAFVGGWLWIGCKLLPIPYSASFALCASVVVTMRLIALRFNISLKAIE